MSTHTFFSLCGPRRLLLSRSLYRSHVLTHFLGPVLGAMMKQVYWHSRRSKAYRGLPEARGQSEAHGDSNLSMGVRPMRHRKTACFGALVLEPHFGSILRPLLATYMGEGFGGQQVPSPLWWRNLLQVLVRELKPLQAAAQSVATGISTVLLWLADAIRHCFLMLALLKPSRRTRQNRNRQQSAASGC